MVQFNLFTDPLRQGEIEKFYEICQKHRNYYKGYPKNYHPLTFFIEPEYVYQCPPEMSIVYLSFPKYHVKYKQPAVLPPTLECTSYMPSLPDRSLKARYGQVGKSFTR